jgi:hypothetical protein
VKDVSRPQNSDDSNQDPKCIQHNVCGVAFVRGTPCQHEGISGVEYPDEHERTFWSEPADEAETEDAHQYANHFYGLNVPDYECNHAEILFKRVVSASKSAICQQLQGHCGGHHLSYRPQTS